MVGRERRALLRLWSSTHASAAWPTFLRPDRESYSVSWLIVLRGLKIARWAVTFKIVK